MRRRGLLQILSCILFSMATQNGQVNAQMPQRGGNQVAILGWTDDVHYLIRTFDSDKNLVIQSIDIKTGKGVVVPPVKTDRELLAQALPPGTSLTMTDAVSPDMKSALIVKDNDLFYFKIGDKELKRLTNDKTPEVNARFSPDGKKVAYTKNKDLYVFDIAGNKETRLTFDATDKIYTGYSSWFYMEEILGRPSRYAAFWWSPAGNQLPYTRTV